MEGVENGVAKGLGEQKVDVYRPVEMSQVIWFVGGGYRVISQFHCGGRKVISNLIEFFVVV